MFPFSFTEIKLATMAVVLLGTAGLSAWATHSIDNTRYVKLELAYKQAEEKAVQAALDKQVNIDKLKNKQALDAAAKQQQITKQTQAKLNEVNKYINDTKYGCIDIGTIRLFNSTIVDNPTQLVPITSGKSNAECSGIGASDFARVIIKDLSIAKQNAQQLNDLIKSLQEINKAAN